MPFALHVEDDDTVAFAFRTVMEEAKIPLTIARVSDGAKALEYLRAQGCFAHAQRPDIVFLDLNLPKVDGWQVLAAIYQDKQLCVIPVIVLSTSARQTDKERAFSLGAKYYISKPSTLDGLAAEVCGVCRQFGLK
jgi:CheY-like chemotaxis protein